MKVYVASTQHIHILLCIVLCLSLGHVFNSALNGTEQLHPQISAFHCFIYMCVNIIIVFIFEDSEQ